VGCLAAEGDLVTLSFLDEGATTTAVLHQAPFATAARRALREGGWTEGFERLERLLGRG